MVWFKRKPEFEKQQKIKNITEKMDQAIKCLEERAEYRKNAIRARAVRYLESRLDEITDYMIERINTENTSRVHSKVYSVTDIFGIEEEPFGDTIMNALRGGGDNNIFDKFLCDNKLTMAINKDATKVKFAYGRHSWFESGWSEWAGYDLY